MRGYKRNTMLALSIFANTHNGSAPSLPVAGMASDCWMQGWWCSRPLTSTVFLHRTRAHRMSHLILPGNLKRFYFIFDFCIKPKKLVLTLASVIFHVSLSLLSLLYACVWLWNKHVRRSYWGCWLTEVMILYWTGSFTQDKKSVWTSNQMAAKEGLMRSTLWSTSRWVIFLEVQSL